MDISRSVRLQPDQHAVGEIAALTVSGSCRRVSPPVLAAKSTVTAATNGITEKAAARRVGMLHPAPPAPKRFRQRGIVLATVLAISVSACALRPAYKAPTVAPVAINNADSSL